MFKFFFRRDKIISHFFHFKHKQLDHYLLRYWRCKIESCLAVQDLENFNFQQLFSFFIRCFSANRDQIFNVSQSILQDHLKKIFLEIDTHHDSKSKNCKFLYLKIIINICVNFIQIAHFILQKINKSKFQSIFLNLSLAGFVHLVFLQRFQ